MIGFCFRTALATGVLLCALPALSVAVEMGDTGKREDPGVNMRTLHYTHDQGLRLIAVSWLQALKQPKESGFRGVGLARYGYMPMEGSSRDSNLGFSVTGVAPPHMAGMICSACQTRGNAVSGIRSPIETTTKSLDFQGLLADIQTRPLTVVKASF